MIMETLHDPIVTYDGREHFSAHFLGVEVYYDEVCFVRPVQIKNLLI